MSPYRGRDERGRNTEGPVPVGEVLKAISKRIGAPAPDALTVVFRGWEELVGASMAAHVKPLKLDGGTLVVAADHPAWATQVRHLSAEILERLRAKVPAESAPARIEVRVRT
ncbi:MAG TPA: DUF721 domain-containing protein [Acidimicrobiales bacterium]|nr:DUF721 domain-containing protein [Acidimicrobiales bacterium]